VEAEGGCVPGLFCHLLDEHLGGQTRVVRRAGQGDDLSNTTLFIGAVSSSVAEEDLKSLFARFGPVVYCKIPAGGAAPKGCAFVQFVSRSSAEHAMHEMHGKVGSCPAAESFAVSPRPHIKHIQLGGCACSLRLPFCAQPRMPIPETAASSSLAVQQTCLGLAGERSQLCGVCR
jgi:hypothetical protein